MFMHKLDNIITDSLTDCIIDPTDIPCLLIKIIDLLQVNIKFYYLTRSISPEEAYKLFDMYRIYIIQKIVFEFNTKEFNKVYNNCIQLAIMNLNFVKVKKPSWLCINCIKIKR